MQVQQVMTHGAKCIRPSNTLREAAERRRPLDAGFLPVCGPSDRLTGMIPDRDIIIWAVADGQDINILQAQNVLSPEVTSRACNAFPIQSGCGTTSRMALLVKEISIKPGNAANFSSECESANR